MARSASHEDRATANFRRTAKSSFTVIIPAVMGLLRLGCGQEAAAAPPPMEVNAVTVATTPFPLPLSYTARSRGEREVEVRARVSGILLPRFYGEGEEAAAGERLFLIDPQPFAAEVRSAQGRLNIEEARLQAATRQWRRVQQLSDRGFVSARNRDDAEADYFAGKASVASARAELVKARLDLGYTDVRAPIRGITGREARSEGSLVNASDDSALLTTITQTDRLYVDFSMPEAEARMLRAAIAANPNAVTVLLSPANGERLDVKAGIDFVSTRVTPGTGTVDVRASLDNRAAQISPGQFVRADVKGLTTASGTYVPARAVLHTADGPFVWKVVKGTAAMQPVKLGDATANLLRIESGLAAGDRVIVDGVLKLEPGAPVKATTIALDQPAVPVAAAP